MHWLVDLFRNDCTAHTILILSLVIAAGVAIGRIRIRGVSFGIAGVLFAGILFSHFGVAINEPVLDFVKDFGLVLFVYMIGLQVGPGFFASFRRLGLAINLQAVSVVVLGVAVAVLFRLLFSLPADAGGDPLRRRDQHSQPGGGAAGAEGYRRAGAALRQAGLGYAVAYPFGVLGVILAMVLTRRLFRIGLEAENRPSSKPRRDIFPAPESMNLEVMNPQLSGRPLSVLAGVIQADIVVSRILRGKELFTPVQDTALQSGDVLLAVGREIQFGKAPAPGWRRERGRPEKDPRAAYRPPDPGLAEKSDRPLAGRAAAAHSATA